MKFLITRQNKSAIRGAQLVPIGMHTFFFYTITNIYNYNTDAVQRLTSHQENYVHRFWQCKVLALRCFK